MKALYIKLIESFTTIGLKVVVCIYKKDETTRDTHGRQITEPEVFIAEQMNKPPCRLYATEGYCEYELGCRYSHIMTDLSGQPIYPPELIAWLQETTQVMPAAGLLKQQEDRPKQQQQQSTPKYRLPPGWKVRDLPPSLKPPPAKHGYQWTDLGTWG